MEQKKNDSNSSRNATRSFDKPSQERTYMNQEKTYYKTKCTDCGKETEVPFKPMEGRPVFCRDCFRKNKPTN